MPSRVRYRSKRTTGKQEQGMSLFDLHGKTAVITGSSRGIGKAIALRMAEHGARVVVSSRKIEACEAVVREIVDAGGEAIAQPCHIGRKDDLQALVGAADRAYGGIDILVCSAGVNVYSGPTEQMPDDAYDRVMNSNVKSAFWLCNMALPGMARRGGGSVILISSIGGIQGSDRLGVYCLSKAAEMQMARNIAVEYGPRGIRANCIAPGLIHTDFSRALWDDPAFYKQAVLEAPLQRIGQPDDIAAAAVFLASAGGSFMTGQTLVIDGGRTIGRVIGAD
jgi:NAD(P)-dependent dehydrogenase (short-subunit alcohol dehydrogenase family)